MKIEGKNAVREILNSKLRIDKVLILKGATDLNDIVSQAKNKRIRVDFVDKQVLDRQSENGHHQGVLAYASDYNYCDVDATRLKMNDNFFMLMIF